MAFSILDSRNPLRKAAPLRHVSGREWSDWGDVVIVPFGNDNVAFQREKDPWKAVEERKIMRRDAGKDPIAAQAMLHAASQPCIGSLLYWINSFAWTYKVLEVDDEGQETAVMDEAAEYPFLTWPAQDKFIASVHDGIRFGQALIVDKSRAQGSSWVILTVFHWFWQYTRNVHFMEMSRVEDLVDSRSGTGQNAGSDDPDTLFWKHDFLIRKQPGFLVPRHRRSRMRLTNDSLQSSIRGRATSPQQGRAGRRTASLIDEAGMIDCLEQIWRSLSRTSPCRIANSTPNGPVYYSKLVRDASAGKRGKLIQLHWSDHPEHGKGRYESTEDDGTIRIRSPWYDEQSTRMTAKDRAQELDLDHFGAGDLFFDKPTIDMQGRFACEPFHTGVIGYDGDDRDEDLRIGGARAIGHLGWVHRSSGHWRLWVDIAPDRHGILRPPQMWTYSIGVDVSA